MLRILSSSIPVFWRQLGWCLLVVVVAYMPLFWLLGSHPVQQFDEARTGLNGLNILRNHEWLVLRDADQQPDLWNCKPPLWPWLLALSFKLVGFSELGLRLPAALAGLATTLVVFWEGRRWLGHWGGLLAAVVLLTSAGFAHYHVTRTGDFDSLLTLWTTLGALAWLRYLHEGRSRHAGLAGLFFFLAAFTKGIAGLLFGPGLLVATLALGHGPRLRRPAPWLALLGLLTGMATWYAVREHAAPGYLRAVWAYEVGGPATQQLEGHVTEAYYYLANLVEFHFSYWLVPALGAAVLGWRLPAGSPGRYLTRFTVSVAVTFMVTLALTQNKLAWYDAPVYPLLALLAAGGLVLGGQAVAAQQGRRPGPVVRWGALALLVALPYWALCRTLVRTYDARYDVATLRLGAHLRHQAAAIPGLRTYYLGEDGFFNDSPLFYRLAMELAAQHHSTRVPPWKIAETMAGGLVVVCGAVPRRRWETMYRTRMVLETDSCVTLRLEARR